uniref:RRM domain-containing protein n=2 Tax=Acrobeloides nanus TaxID=290746 RepID=A0A914CET3_9BILA
MSSGHSVFVGNLPYRATEDDLGNLFSQAGRVNGVRIVYDRDTNRAKGFGFIEFGSEQDAQNAVSQLDGSEFQGRQLRVNIATKRN